MELINNKMLKRGLIIVLLLVISSSLAFAAGEATHSELAVDIIKSLSSDNTVETQAATILSTPSGLRNDIWNPQANNWIHFPAANGKIYLRSTGVVIDGSAPLELTGNSLTTGQKPKITIQDKNGDCLGMLESNKGLSFNILTTNACRLALGAQGTEHLTVATNGNVGIGSVNPQAKLDIRGPGPSSTPGSNHFLVLGDQNFGWRVEGQAIVIDSANSGVWKPTLAINRIDGNVGIGTSTPNAKLQVIGNISGTKLCIGNDCKTAWPSGGHNDGADCPAGQYAKGVDANGIATGCTVERVGITAETDPTVMGWAKTNSGEIRADSVVLPHIKIRSINVVQTLSFGCGHWGGYLSCPHWHWYGNAESSWNFRVDYPAAYVDKVLSNKPAVFVVTAPFSIYSNQITITPRRVEVASTDNTGFNVNIFFHISPITFGVNENVNFKFRYTFLIGEYQ